MKRPTVKKLNAEIERLEEYKGEIHLSSAIVWHWEQIAVEIEKYDRYGELVKVEITHSYLSGKRSYNVLIWHHALLNKQSRQKLGIQGFYAGLEASADRYFPVKR